VIPIDSAAPKGRLILPQQQTIRDILEAGAAVVAVKETELRETLERLAILNESREHNMKAGSAGDSRSDQSNTLNDRSLHCAALPAFINAPGFPAPKLVITDSQVFGKVSPLVPDDIFLTSFSILFARYKGSLLPAVKGAKALDDLADGDTILISEGCTHHRQCDDIGTVKLPHWILEHTCKQIQFAFTSGTEFPGDLSPYKLIVHCGGCMLNEREMKYRVKCALDQNVPMTNYGILIAYINGILKRSVAMFPQVAAELG